MKSKNTILSVCLAVLLGIGLTVQAQAPDYSLTKHEPGIIFGYSSDTPIIKDQAQVATVVHPVNNDTGGMLNYKIVSIDGVKIGTKKKSPFRIYGERSNATVDLLPGKHTLTIEYWENIWVNQKTGKYASINPGKPIDVEMVFEAGNVYMIKALVSNYNFMGLTIDKELTDPTIVERIAASRSKAE